VPTFPIGDQRVGIERETVTGYTDYGEPITSKVTVWVDNACFEIQTPSEQQNMTVTTSEIAWAFLPVADSVVPAVDDDGADASLPFFISNPGQDDDGKPTINANVWLRHNGLRYAMRGDAVLEQDLRGRQDHVFCVCEREEG
jgi:hypothetical protein